MRARSAASDVMAVTAHLLVVVQLRRRHLEARQLFVFVGLMAIGDMNLEIDGRLVDGGSRRPGNKLNCRDMRFLSIMVVPVIATK